MLAIAALLGCLTLAPSHADTLWDTYGEYATRLEPLDPTPMGEGHLGPIKSGQFVQLRFPVPKGKVLGYWLQLGNVVAYSGKGSSYQLVLRKGAPDGPVAYEGPVIANGDQWNGSNVESKDVTQAIAREDQDRGYLDLWVTGLVKDDDWTVYRQNPEGRRMAALVAVATPELEKRLAAAKALADAGLAVVPMPQEIELGAGRVALDQPSIRLAAGTGQDDAFAAEDLAEQIAQRTGYRPKVLAGESQTPCITLRVAKGEAPAQEGRVGEYRLRASAERGVEIAAASAEGRFYGAQTLAQLVVAEGKEGKLSLPVLTIRDWPAFPVRAFQYDIARGQTVDVEFCKHVIRDLARYKLNAIMFYLEDDFRFDKYPFMGRPGTFTPEKARELSAFARQYHVMLIPQFEALGHAGAALSHEELAGLREAGGSWVFCTSEPKTWEFLRDVFTELAAAFPDSPYLHVGGDEFEGGFGLCERCKAKGIDALYVEHMTKLNDICRSLGKTMLFWPSHGGPTPELSYLTLKTAPAMPHNCIPTEWIYHGPPSYPEIKQYQDAGFQDVWVCPAVVGYGVIWPDYPTTFRGLRGFYQAGAERGVKGACATTWEFMYGALFENSWLGLCYAAECGWSLGRTPVGDYERRWAGSWLGAKDPEAEGLVASTLAEPLPATGEGARWRDSMLVRRILWNPLRSTRRQFCLKQPDATAAAPQLVSACDADLARLDRLRQLSSRNPQTLDFAEVGLRMMRLAGRKLVALDAAAQAYTRAGDQLPRSRDDASASLRTAGQELDHLAPEYEWLAGRLRYAADTCGHWDGDAKALDAQRTELSELVAKLSALADDVAAGRVDRLPPAATFGLESGTMVKVGEWTPAQCSEQGFEFRADLTPHVKAGQRLSIEFEYTNGAHALRISRVALMANGTEVARDEHAGMTGAANQGNTYELIVPEAIPADAKIELVASVASWGGNDSAGIVWLTAEAAQATAP